MDRLVKAFVNSMRAWQRLIVGEMAFRQEVAVLALALPAAWFLATGWHSYAAMVLSIVFLIIVEVLNTAIEAACNATTREFDKDIQLAKDCGSLAVLLSVLIVAVIWVLAVHDWMVGRWS